MKKACYGRVNGPEVTPQEFIHKATPLYKERNIFPYCKACGQRVDLYGVNSPEGPSRFDHPNYPNDADPLDDCILANRTRRFRGLQPSGFDEDREQGMRNDFFALDNLRKTYFFMWRLCGRGCLPREKFVQCIQRADRKKIWAYHNIDLWCIPYILLTLNNFMSRNFEFHFFIDKRLSSPIDEIWEGQKICTLCKVFSDSGRLLKSSEQIQNPFPISIPAYNGITLNTDWPDDSFLVSLQMACNINCNIPER